MGVSFLGESAQCREARNRLLDQEAGLRRGTEAVGSPGATCGPAAWSPRTMCSRGSYLNVTTS